MSGTGTYFVVVAVDIAVVVVVVAAAFVVVAFVCLRGEMESWKQAGKVAKAVR